MTAPLPFDRSADLLSKHFDGSLTESEHAELSDMLRSDATLRERMVELMIEDALLSESHPTIEAPLPIYRKGCEPAERKLRWPVMLAAAGVAIAAAGLAIYTSMGDPEPEPRRTPIATLVDATGPVLVDNDMADRGRDYPAGVVDIAGGTADFMMTSGVGVHLRGKSRVIMRTPMSAAITRGTAAFRCPPGAAGYTVHLPDGSRIVDLSTAFEVYVGDDGEQIVEVTEGLVDLNYGEETRSLTTDHAARYADGRWEIVDVSGRGIASHSESVRVLAFAPKSVAAGELEDSDRVFVIRERTDVVLDKPMAVAIREPGEFGFDKLSSGPLAAGTRVDSYLLHYDAVGDDKDARMTIEADVTFDRPVLGLIVKSGINANDAMFAHPDTTYEQDKTRGIEIEDVVILSEDRRTVTLKLTGWRPDQVRVFVKSKPIGNESPAALPAGDAP